MDNFSPHKNDDLLVSRGRIMTWYEMEMKKPPEENCCSDKMYFEWFDNFFLFFFSRVSTEECSTVWYRPARMFVSRSEENFDKTLFLTRSHDDGAMCKTYFQAGIILNF